MSLLIGLHIVDALTKAKKVADKIGDRIYPLAAVSGAPSYPFVTFEVVGIQDEGTKDGSALDTVNVLVSAVSKSYVEAVNLANDIRYTLQGACVGYADKGFEVRDCGLVGSQEDYVEELPAYAVSVVMWFKTMDY